MNRRLQEQALRPFSFLTVALLLFGAFLSAGRVYPQDVPLVEVEKDGGYVRFKGYSRVIVFMHGLNSGPDAWRCEDGHYWPEMISHDSDPVFAQTDIYVVKYRTPNRGNHMTMSDLASSIYNQLDAKGIFDKHQEVIFVAHSMGGILTQQILATYINEKLSDKVHMLMLYGTPQEGSTLANIASVFNKDPLLKELQSGDGNLILPELDQRWHHASTSKIQLNCAYETQKEEGFKVVSQASATRGCDDALAIESDHHNLVKPCKIDDPAYTFFERKLKADEASSSSSSSKNISTYSNVPFNPRQASLLDSTSGPYARLTQLRANLNILAGSWTGSIEQAGREYDQTLYSFHRRAYGSQPPPPPPTRYPDEILDKMIEVDRSTTSKFASFLPDLNSTRSAALACMQLTPNEAQQDYDVYTLAELQADKSTSVSVLSKIPLKLNDRFGPLAKYIESLQRKLGDYHCPTS